MSEKESGAQGRKRRKREHEIESNRERDRNGLNAEWDALLKKIGPPPLDATENSAWANNLAAGMASIIAKDETIPLADRFKRTAEMLDRVSGTAAKAVTAQAIKKIKERAGVSEKKERHADGILEVRGGSRLRARDASRARVSGGSVPELSKQEDGPGVDAGGRPVGSDDPEVH